MMYYVLCFFFKQKTAYEMRISDWSSDVCSSDLRCMIIGARCRGAARLPSLDFQQVTGPKRRGTRRPRVRHADGEDPDGVPSLEAELDPLHAPVGRELRRQQIGRAHV